MRRQKPIPLEKRRRIGVGGGILALLIGLILSGGLYTNGESTFAALALLLFVAISVGMFNFARGPSSA